MNSKLHKLSKIFLFCFMLISCFAPSLILASVDVVTDGLGEMGENEQENMISDMESFCNDEQLALQSPSESAATYQNMEYSSTSFYSIGVSFENTIVTDVAETANYYYLTGYTVNTTDNNYQLFWIRSSKAGVEDRTIFWRNTSTWETATGGLAIAVNETNDELFIGGFQGFHEKNTTSSRFATYDIGILQCYTISTGALKWNTTIGTGGTDFGDTSGSKYDFGGERIEDIVILPFGDIVVTGGISVHLDYGYTVHGITTFVGRVNRLTGLITNMYKNNVAYDGLGPTLDSPTPNYGKKIIYRSVSDSVYVMSHRRRYSTTTNHWAIDYSMTLVDSSMVDSFHQQVVQYNTLFFNPYNNTYFQLNDIVFNADQSYLWGVGTYHYQIWDSSTPWNFWEKPFIIEMNPLSNCDKTGETYIDFQTNNRSAVFIGHDGDLIDTTVYIAGRRWSNSSTQEETGLWLGSYDFDNKRLIYETYYPNPPSYINLTLAGWAGDFINNVTLFAYADSSLNFQTNGYLFEPTAPINVETLTQLPTNVNGVELDWTNIHNELRYFYIFRNDSVVGLTGTPTDLTGFKQIVSLEWQYTYTDYAANNDQEKYWYALVCGNDFGNSSTIQFTSTTYFLELIEPVVELANPDSGTDIVIKPSEVNLTWNEIYQAEFKIYRSREEFDPDGYPVQATLVGTPGVGTTSWTQPVDQVGVYYYMVQAYNATRLSWKNSSLVRVHVQEIAISPSNLIVTTTQEKSIDGIVELEMDAWPGTSYTIYAKLDSLFDYDSVSQAVTNTQYENGSIVILGSQTASGDMIYLDVMVPVSGNWYIAALGSNSTGVATSLSNFDNVTVGIIPYFKDGDGIYLVSENPHTSNIVRLAWDEAVEAEYYLIYRTSGESEGQKYNLEDISKCDLVYNGTALSFDDLDEKETNMLYFYAIVPVNKHGQRDVDITLENTWVSARIAYTGDDGNNTQIALIVGLSVLGAALIGGYVYKKRNPWAGM